MSDPCAFQDTIIESKERIAAVEAISVEHGKTLERVEHKVDVLLDTVGSLRNNRGFIGGIAATGWLMGALMIDIVKPFVKPLIAAALAVIK